MFDLGNYPDCWCKGVTIPIHTKGGPSNTANYRGITVINVMAKIFTWRRLNYWCEGEDVFIEFQFGFRDNCSTTDCAYLLHLIIKNI